MLNRRLIFLVGALVTVLGVWLLMRPTPAPIERAPDSESDLSGAAPVAPATAPPTAGAATASAGTASPSAASEASAASEPAPALVPSPGGGAEPERVGAQPTPNPEHAIPRADHYVHPDGGIHFKDAAAMRHFLHR